MIHGVSHPKLGRLACKHTTFLSGCLDENLMQIYGNFEGDFPKIIVHEVWVGIF